MSRGWIRVLVNLVVEDDHDKNRVLLIQPLDAQEGKVESVLWTPKTKNYDPTSFQPNLWTSQGGGSNPTSGQPKRETSNATHGRLKLKIIIRPLDT